MVSRTVLSHVTRSSLVAILPACLAALAPACAGPRSPAQPPAPRAPVVVTIVVDQLAAWVATERWPELPRTGGFARLLREGTYVPEAHHQHACTDTAPGHATLYTGASPHDHGIFGNEVVDAASRGRASILRDPASKLVTGEGAQAEPGSSLARLRVETLSDRLRAEHPDAYVVSISLKDRGALFAAGRRSDAAVWWDPKRMAFVTSSAVGADLPAFARKEGSRAAVEAARTVWQPLDPAWVQAHAPTPDAAPGEGDWGGYGTTFPHDVTKAKSPGGVYRAHPDSD